MVALQKIILDAEFRQIFSLCRKLEEASDELRLTYRIITLQSFDLTLM
jgi:hypothetical protein